MINFNFEKHCYGCAACINICPNNAISIIKNKEGFYNPFIDKEKCSKCGLCEKKCIYLKKIKSNSDLENVECYAMQLKDNKDIMYSSSGGVFIELARKILENGGYVSGCVWDENMMAKHIITNDTKELQKMRGSKYVQSDIGKIYKDIQNLLKQRKKVIFTGLPCQIQALKEIVGENENLYTCSLICEGVPSPEIWKKYKEYFEKKQKSKLVSVNFRSKEKYGWNRPIIKMKFENGNVVENLSYNLDKYMILFITGKLMNNSCYECKFKKDKINSDIIIGDFWGFSDKKTIKNYKKYGVSSVIIKTEKGKILFNNIKNKYNVKQVKYEEIAENNPNLERCLEKSLDRDFIYKEMNDNEIYDLLSRRSNSKLIKKGIIKILYKTNLLKYLEK